MRYNKILAAALLGSALLTGCKDDFAEINTDPSVVAKPDVRFLFTGGLKEFIPNDYWAWYYDYTTVLRWGQSTVVSGSNPDDLNFMREQGGMGGMAIRVMRYANDIKYNVGNMTAEEQAKYQHIRVMSSPMMVFLGMLDSDMIGSMPYSEAMQAHYTNPPLLTPKYDTQEEMYNLWEQELTEAVDVLSNPVYHNGVQITQMALGAQDFVYKGDAAKWAKFANTLRLKLAVRMLSVDKARAIALAETAAASPAGLMNSLDDDFVYNRGSQYYGFNDNINPGTISKHLCDFLVENQDPRVRFFFKKNDFNSKVVQAYFDANARLPFYIDEVVEYTEVDGKKKFSGWKGAGEPWVRYFGAPSEVNANLVAEYEDYFDPKSQIFKISLNGKEKSYQPLAAFNIEMLQGQKDYDYPDAPDASVVQDKEDYPIYELVFSSGEANLLLAEFKLLGANLPGSAADYFARGVKLSVEGFDKVAGLSHIPYYHETYDANETSVKLQNGEVDYLLEQDAYKLTGNTAEDLEKIYIQLHIHYTMSPMDMFVTMRRSGIPAKNSAIFEMKDFKQGYDYPLPRRFTINEPLKSDKMYENAMKAYTEQNFTLSTNEPSVLARERVWSDQNAPEYGTGVVNF